MEALYRRLRIMRETVGGIISIGLERVIQKLSR
jgi:hypothetical protein